MTDVLSPGTRLGLYEIVSKLEIEGEMSTAYRACVSGGKHYVALKVVPVKCPSDCDADEWRRKVNALEWEASIFNILGAHPNIVRYHGKGKTDEWQYLAFDFIEGEDLETMIDCPRASTPDAVIPVRRAVEIAKKVATGLHYVHKKGIVHSDIKPENILIGKRTVKIIDFGIAYDMNNIDNNPKYGPDIFLGTIEFAPFEYIRNRHEPHPQGDVYSLGATLFHMLTRETPFEPIRNDLLTALYLDAINFEDVVPFRLKSLAPHVPETVQQVCIKALEKKSDKRFQSAKEFAEALESVLKKI